MLARLLGLGSLHDRFKVKNVTIQTTKESSTPPSEIVSPPNPAIHPPLNPVQSAAHSKLSSWDRILGGMVAGFVDPVIFYRLEKRIKLGYVNQAASGENMGISYRAFLEGPKQFLRSAIAPFTPTPVAFIYAILHRPGKFAGEPILKKRLKESRLGGVTKHLFGDQASEIVLHGVAGLGIGLTVELPLLALDAEKSRQIVNPTSDNFIQQMQTMWGKMKTGDAYRGGVPAAIGYSFGSAALFSSAAVVYHYLFHLKDRRDATFLQSILASSVGASLFITISNPFNVLTTRMQTNAASANQSTLSLVKKIAQEEGIKKFGCGLKTRLMWGGPRVVVSMKITDSVASMWHNAEEKKATIAAGNDKPQLRIG